MTDLIIFGFGLGVTFVVGGGLSWMIVVKNRALDAEERAKAEAGEVTAFDSAAPDVDSSTAARSKA